MSLVESINSASNHGSIVC